MSSIAQLIAAKKAAQASAEAAQLFPAELAIDLALLLNPDSYSLVRNLDLLLDWLGPFDKPKPQPEMPGISWRWIASWKTLAIAQRMGLSNKQVSTLLLMRGMTKLK